MIAPKKPVRTPKKSPTWRDHAISAGKVIGSTLKKFTPLVLKKTGEHVQKYGVPVAKKARDMVNEYGPYVLANAALVGGLEYAIEGFRDRFDITPATEEALFYSSLAAFNLAIIAPVKKYGLVEYATECVRYVRTKFQKRAYEFSPAKKTEINKPDSWKQNLTAIGLLAAGFGLYEKIDEVPRGIERARDDISTVIEWGAEGITTSIEKVKEGLNNTSTGSTDDTDAKEKDTGAKEKKPESKTDGSNLLDRLMGTDNGNEVLEDQITKYVNSLRSQGKARARGIEDYSIYVKDLRSEEVVADINMNEQRLAASTIKLYVLAAGFDAVESGRLTYGSKMKSHMEKMIRVSDNNSTNWLIKQIGLEKVNQYVQKHEYNDTVVDYIPAGGRTLTNKTSAEDLATLLEHVYKKDIPYAAEMQRIMALKAPGHLDRILDRTCIPKKKVALKKNGGYVSSVKDKTGFIWGVNADAGLVDAYFYNQESGDTIHAPYIAVFMIEDEGAKPTGFRGSANAWGRAKTETIRSISETVYWQLEGTYSDIPAYCTDHKGVHPQ